MSRGYPRFLFSNPTNVKSEGPFIIHTLEPQFIVKPEFDEKRNIIDCRLLKVWSEEYDKGMVCQIVQEIPSWFKLSGNQQSSNQDDVLISSISMLSFLKDRSSHFTVDQAKILIRLLFPTKTKKIYEGSSSYGIKHLFEHVSMTVINSGQRENKYCSNQTILKAFEEEGFKWEQEGPNRYMNISAKEVNRAYKLFWNT